MVKLLAAFLALIAGCGGSDAAGLPSALSPYEQGHEVTPFQGYTAPGLRLYRVVVVGVADLDSSFVVGVDRDGALVSDAALFLRMRGTLGATDLAVRALDTVLGHLGTTPLQAGDPRDTLVDEASWALVTSPVIEGSTLVFWVMQGGMQPELVQHRVDLSRGTVVTTPVVGVRLARGETVVIDPPVCEPVAACGCWSGCARVEAVRIPAHREGAFRWVDGPFAGRLAERHPDCSGERCMKVCRADTPQAQCDDALVLVEDQPCTESCIPSEAPYHCDTFVDHCGRVEHLVRTAAQH